MYANNTNIMDYLNLNKSPIEYIFKKTMRRDKPEARPGLCHPCRVRHIRSLRLENQGMLGCGTLEQALPGWHHALNPQLHLVEPIERHAPLVQLVGGAHHKQSLGRRIAKGL